MTKMCSGLSAGGDSSCALRVPFAGPLCRDQGQDPSCDGGCHAASRRARQGHRSLGVPQPCLPGGPGGCGVLARLHMSSAHAQSKGASAASAFLCMLQEAGTWSSKGSSTCPPSALMPISSKIVLRSHCRLAGQDLAEGADQDCRGSRHHAASGAGAAGPAAGQRRLRPADGGRVPPRHR